MPIPLPGSVGQLSVHYQPKVNLRSGEIESVECLARWAHPERGLIPPQQFIPLAEESGLIKPLSYCVLDTALQQCKRWRRDGITLSITVNHRSLGHRPGAQPRHGVVAEGVETLETWSTLQKMNCDHAQGYYLSRPLPAAEFSLWWRRFSHEEDLGAVPGSTDCA